MFISSFRNFSGGGSQARSKAQGLGVLGMAKISNIMQMRLEDKEVANGRSWCYWNK